MMKIKNIAILILVVLTISIFISCSNASIDYPNVEDFELALNEGEDLTGKSVTFTVDDLVPNSAFGYNMQAGEHLNFCSSSNPNVKEGDTVTVKVIEISSLMGSYIIKYEIVK